MINHGGLYANLVYMVNLMLKILHMIWTIQNESTSNEEHITNQSASDEEIRKQKSSSD